MTLVRLENAICAEQASAWNSVMGAASRLLESRRGPSPNRLICSMFPPFAVGRVRDSRTIDAQVNRSWPPEAKELRIINGRRCFMTCASPQDVSY